MDHYIDKFAGFERHNHFINNIGYSSNVANYYYISQHIQAPIIITVETRLTEFFPTEKSFLGFFTKRIPLILGEPNLINSLRNEGFDLFDDLIDNLHDVYEDAIPKIRLAITNNLDILKTIKNLDQKRVQKNYDYLINDWFDAKLETLIGDIQRQILQ